MRRTLAIEEKSYGPEGPNVATCLHLLALLLQETHRFGKAAPLMLQDMNRLAEAEPLMRRAHGILFSNYGDKHPLTLAARANLERMRASMFRAQQQPAKALSVAHDPP